MYHQSLYQVSDKLFKHETHHILTVELYHSVRSFNEMLYICETCHEDIDKNEVHLRQSAIKWR